MPKPLISVVIPTKNSQAHVRIALEGVSRQTEGLSEVIIADNESTDSTISISRQYGAKIVRVAGPAPQVSRQRNAGARAAKGQYIFFLDHDMELPRGFAESFQKQVTNDPDVDAWYIFEDIRSSGRLLSAIRTYENTCYVNTPLSAVRLIKASTFRETQGYDHKISAGPADWDFDMELHRRGKFFGRATMTLIHHEETLSFLSYVKKKRMYAAGLTAYRNKWLAYDKGVYERYVSKQFNPWYRLVGVFFVEGKWKYTLLHLHLYVGSLIVRMCTLWYYFDGIRGLVRTLWQNKSSY